MLTTSKTVAEFYFRVIEGKSLNKASFRLETYDANNTLIGNLFTTESQQNAVFIGLKDAETDLYYGSKSYVDNLDVTLSFTDDDVDALTAVTIKEDPALTVAVPTKAAYEGNTATGNRLQLTATYQGLDGPFGGSVYPVLWTLDSVAHPDGVTGVSIDMTTGILTVDNTCTAGSVTVKVMAQGSVTDTAVVTITRDTNLVLTAIDATATNDTAATITGRPLTLRLTDKNDSKTVTFTAYDQYGGVIADGVTYSLVAQNGTDTTVAGASFTGNVLTITNGVTPYHLFVKAEKNGTAIWWNGKGTESDNCIAIERAGEVLTTFDHNLGSTAIDVKGGATAEQTVTFTAQDQFDRTITSVVLSFVDSEGAPATYPGLTIDGMTVKVANNAKPATVYVKGTLSGKSITANFAVTRSTAPAPATVAIQNKTTNTASLLVPVGETPATSAAFVAKVYDQYGDEMIGQPIVWTIKDGSADVTGVTIGADGVVSVTKDAKTPITTTEGKALSITAKVSDLISDTDTITIKRDTPVITTVTIGSGAGSIDVPGDKAAAFTATGFTATSLDQYGTEISDRVTWSIVKTVGGAAVNGISISADGKITVAANSSAVKAAVTDTTGTGFTVTATSVGNSAVTKTAYVTIKRAAPAATSVVIYSGTDATGSVATTSNIVKPVGDTAKEDSYHAVLFDQYGAPMTATSWAWTWDSYAGCTLSNGTTQTATLTTTKAAANTSAAKSLTVKANDNSGLTATVAVSIYAIAPNWSNISTIAADQIIYGKTNREIITGLSNTAMVCAVGGSTVGLTGTYSVTDAMQDAGSRTITVTFTADPNYAGNGDYKGVVLTQNVSVTILPALLIVTPDAGQHKDFGAADPTLTYAKSGAVGAQTPAFTGALGYTGTNVGEYDITKNTLALADEPNSGFKASNYTLAVISRVKFKINQATLTIETAPTATAVYGTKAKDIPAPAGGSVKLGATPVAGTWSWTANTAETIFPVGTTAVLNATFTPSTGADNYKVCTRDITPTITQKEITAVAPGTAAVTKVYDGKTDAGTASGALALTGVVSGDNLTLAFTAGTYDTKDVGTTHTVTLTLGALGGTAAGNYKLADGLTSVELATAAITKAAFTYAVDAAQQIKVGSGLAAITVDDAATGTGVNSETPAVTVTWYSNSARTTAATNSDLSGLAIGATKTLYWKAVAAGGNYNDLTGATLFTIVEGDPQIFADGFTTAVGKIYGDAAFTKTTTLTTGAGAITYASSDETVATVGESSGEVTILKAGVITITATAAAVPGEWAESSISYTLTVSPKEVTLRWAGTVTRGYDNTASSVTATVSNKVKSTDVVAVIVTGGTETKAGTHTATPTSLAGADAANYKLPAVAPTQQYTIDRADRALACAVVPTLKLNGDTLSGQVGELTYQDLDKSAVVIYSSGDTAVATVNSAGKITAVGNGSTVIKANIAQTYNYNAATETTVATVVVVTDPVTDVEASSTVAGDVLAATLDQTNRTVRVTGAITAGAKLTVVVNTLKDDATPDPKNLEIAAVDAAKLAEGITLDLPLSGGTVTYTIDTSAVILLPAEVKISEGKAEATAAAGVNDPAVTAALEKTANLDPETGLPAAVAADLIENAQMKLDVVTGATKVVAEVKLKLEATGYQDGQLTLTVTPQVTFTFEDGTGAPVGSPVTENIAPDAVRGPVKVKIVLPAGFATANLFAKQTKADGSIVYLPVTPTVGITDSTNYAEWTQTDFSPVTLLVDTRGGTIHYEFEDGSVRDIPYAASDVGSALPQDSKTGYRFTGWTIEGEQYATLTDALLKAIDTTTKTATPNFTPLGGPVTTYTITVTAGAHGTVEPNGRVSVSGGSDKTFTFTADKDYRVADVLVDGKSVGAVETYTFKTVSASHTLSVTFAAANPFDDVREKDWFYDDVMTVYDKGLMDGVSANLFDPTGTTTRAMAVTVLWRLAGEPAPKAAATFDDVQTGLWYSEAVAWAAENDIVNGIGNNLYAPMQKVTREQLAAILYRYALAIGKAEADGGAMGLAGYPDVGAISPYAVDAMRWAVISGIIGGRTDGTLDPAGNAQRSELAAMLNRLIDKVL